MPVKMSINKVNGYLRNCYSLKTVHIFMTFCVTKATE